MKPLRIAITADLHWGIRPAGDASTRALLAHLRADSVDGLILAGDVGAGDQFAPCLELFADLPGWKALVPGNHDIWVTSDDARGDSLEVYRTHLPALCRSHGFHYLDDGPLLLPESDLAVVGCINWYDYSWSIDRLPAASPHWEQHLREKWFTRGRLNDARYVRWPLDDVRFTASVVETFAGHLSAALRAVGRALAVTHYPPFQAVSFPLPDAPGLDDLLWEAFGGNQRMEEVLQAQAERVAFAFCGHTHRARTGDLGPIRGHNVGSDYPFKRLLVLDWPAGTLAEFEFRAE
jgi:predicted phosphohydrolase